MEKKAIVVPQGVRYISDWPGFRLPPGQCIIDKTICGCGFTEYCLRPGNQDNIILCSPRIVLLENKVAQHQGDPGIYYYQSDLLKEEYEGEELTDPESHNRGQMVSAASRIREHVLNCSTSGRPARILCTYDSFHTIKDALSGFLQNFKVVVDEFQNIFVDAFFKAEVENQFFRELCDVPNVIYLSATPMLDRYLSQIDGFAGLTYYKLVWPSQLVEKAVIQEHRTNSLVKEALAIVRQYKNPNELKRPMKNINGNLIISQEVVFYVNSVVTIRSIIRQAGLSQNEVNVICSKTPANYKKLAKIGIDIGDPPLLGEPHKMFTFCTRTTYLGADFYHPSATTVVLSDANVNSLVLDVRLDLPQILGRQRLDSNPWKNECTIFYKTLSPDLEITQENWELHMGNKRTLTEAYLRYANSLPPGLREMEAKIFTETSHRGNTIRLCGLTGDQPPEFVYNQLLEISEQRAYELSQVDFKNSITVVRNMYQSGFEVQHYSTEADVIVQKVIDALKGIPKHDIRLELYCRFREQYKTDPAVTERALSYFIGTDLENLYSYFGIDQIKACKYRIKDLSDRLSDTRKSDTLQVALDQVFKPGTAWSTREAKLKLREIYLRLGIKASPKATDLKKYYSVSNTKVTGADKKRHDAFKILGYLEQPNP